MSVRAKQSISGNVNGKQPLSGSVNVGSVQHVGVNLPVIDESVEGMYLKVENGAPIWAPMTVPEQYGLISYDQDKTITIT